MRVFVIVLPLLLAACATSTVEPVQTLPEQVVDHHNSRNSLDWMGVYRGVLPCADCPGIEHELTLSADGGYRLATRYLERQTEPTVVNGRFQWNEQGSHIQLDAAGEHAWYQVREGALLRGYADGSWPSGAQIETMTLTQQR